MLAVGLVPPPVTHRTGLVSTDPHLGSPVGPHLAKTDVALCLPTSGQIWEAAQPSHSRERGQSYRQGHNTGGQLWARARYLCALSRRSRSSWCRCLRLSSNILCCVCSSSSIRTWGAPRGEGPGAALGTEFPKHHLAAEGIPGLGGFCPLPCHPDAIWSRYGSSPPTGLFVLHQGPLFFLICAPQVRQWGSPGSPAPPHGPGR